MFSASISRRTRTHGLAAVSLYKNGEITLGTAARLAGVNRFEMRDILRKEGVELRFGPEDMDAGRDDIEAARNLE